MELNLIEAALAKNGPKVIGTILTRNFLERFEVTPELPCDIVELRVDGYPEYEEWAKAGARIEAGGRPVIMTLRISDEGGKWTGADRERISYFEKAIGAVSCVDVELRSGIAAEICKQARGAGKWSIVSYHNFKETPPVPELKRIVEEAREIGSIVKIAAKVNSLDDTETLRCILQGRWDVPLCIIGMGPLGKETRLRFPLEGSCFTYGYLDVPGAPGQFSALELKNYLKPITSA
jgi:3-dehydroquinate dehydratase-1